jgi:hypothetical protein
MHLFQATILALWFSYRHKPELWKVGLIFVCFGLGFFDKFNFIWLVSAFLVGILPCYPDSVKNLLQGKPALARLFFHQSAITAFTLALASARGKTHSGRRRRTGTDLDATHSLDLSGKRC